MSGEDEEPPPGEGGHENEDEEEEDAAPAGGPGFGPGHIFGIDLMQLLQHRLQHHRAESNDGLVKSLKKRKLITSEHIAKAFLALPRGEFLDQDLQEEAYEDSPLRFAAFGINISAPHMYATCLEALQLEPGNNFLDIGSGCGHMTCLGGYLIGKTGASHGLDIRKDIVDYAEQKTRAFSRKSGIDLSNVSYFLRNCFLADKEAKLYDRIHVGACCPQSRLPDLQALLTPGGILVTPYADKLIKVTKGLDGKITTETLASVRYGDLIIPSEAEIRESLLVAKEYRAVRAIKVPDDGIVRDFKGMVNNEKTADVVFMVEGKPFYAHKFMLGLRCPFLETIVKQKHQQTTATSSFEHTEVVVPVISYDVFSRVMEFVYCGETNIAKTMVDDVMHAAKEVHIVNLVKQCQEYFEHGIEPTPSGFVLFKESIVPDLSDLVGVERLSDVVFLVEDKRVYGHRFVLALRSQYFRSVLTMFSKEAHQAEIAIKDVEYDSFMTVIAFIYTGRANLVNEDNAVDVLEAANYFSEERLKCVCQDVLKKGVDLENVSYILDVAVRFEANQLRRACTEVILQNFPAVAKTKTFRDLDRELVVKLMGVACKRLKRNYRSAPTPADADHDFDFS